MRFKVILELVAETKDEEEMYGGLEKQSQLTARGTVDADSIGWAIGVAIEMLRVPRKCDIVAEIVGQIFEGAGDEDREPWPGYNKAMDQFVMSATAIRDGWIKHDKIGASPRKQGTENSRPQAAEAADGEKASDCMSRGR
jgi:hypothetical protein